MKKLQKIKAHCVQCNNELDAIIDEPALTSAIFVCVTPDCPNFGLLTISREKIDEFLKPLTK